MKRHYKRISLEIRRLNNEQHLIQQLQISHLTIRAENVTGFLWTTSNRTQQSKYDTFEDFSDLFLKKSSCGDHITEAYHRHRFH